MVRPVRQVATACRDRLSGALLLALEVVWFRFLSMYVLVTTLAMSLMLAVVLAGIGAGWPARIGVASASRAHGRQCAAGDRVRCQGWR